jgi:hypothetical protein
LKTYNTLAHTFKFRQIDGKFLSFRFSPGSSTLFITAKRYARLEIKPFLDFSPTVYNEIDKKAYGFNRRIILVLSRS